MAPPGKLLRRGAGLIALLLGLLPLAAARAQQVGGDIAAKARMVVTFARFVEWPAARFADDPALRLCVVHASPAVAAAFAPHAGSDINGRRLDIRFAAAVPAGPCHALYVDASAARAAAPALGAPGIAGTALTLGSGEGFLAHGGMIEILIVDDALRFDINLAALRSAQLGLNPGVLKLARRVRQEP